MDATGEGGLSRRRLVRDAGFAAAGAAITAGLACGEDAEAAPTAVTAINVRAAPYEARGDGSTDDSDAIQRALDDVGSTGGAVYFPPGDYRVGRPLAPRSRTLMHGCHTSRWIGAEDPPSACKVRVGDDFSGGGLVAPDGDTVAVTIRNLALVGDGGATEGLHGLRMPDLGDAAGALSWALEDVTIAGFGGDGIFGRMHVAILENCFIHNNRGWGINASDGNRWNDVHVSACFVFFNDAGNLYFGGEETSAGVDFVNCRFERAGTDPDDVFEPRNPGAPGVRLANARRVEFANCNTDANTGSGFEIVREDVGVAGLPADILLVNCRISRDGTGDNRDLGEFAGIEVRGLGRADGDRVTAVKCVNCAVSSGLADDSGGGDVLGPRYGVWYEDTSGFQWIGGRVGPAERLPSGEPLTGNAYYVGADGNEQATIVDLERGLLTLPLEEPGGSVPDGSVYFDAAAGRLRIRRSGRWLSLQAE